MKHDLIYYIPWDYFTREQIPYLLRECLDWGIHRFVFGNGLIRQCLKDPSWIGYMHNLERSFGVQFLSMHAPFGPEYDMNIIDPVRRPEMIKEHSRSMEIAAEFGCQTYTIHIGAYHYIFRQETLQESRDFAAATLEKLVPAAEKTGVTIAVENSFEPTNAAREVLALVTPYIGNPAVGVCFDTGHANIMAMPPGKRPDRYRANIYDVWYEDGIIPENNALEILYPHIVTTHMHDNDGYGDLHAMPGDGTIDWKTLLPKLDNCPRMVEMQTEVSLYHYGINWAGELLAPMGGYTINRLVKTFRKLGF
jgi:sugar phosphate isomerase/epimerase